VGGSGGGQDVPGQAREARAAGPELMPVRMHLLTPEAPGRAVVVSSERCTASRDRCASFVRHVVLDVSGTPLAGAFVPGQSFGVLPPGTDAHGRPHKVRLYSVASPTRGEDGRGCHISTTVKRTIDEHWETHRLFLGVASNHLCDLQPGETVLVTGPSGKRFVLPRSPGEHDYLFIATGTGIAPFRGMILDLLEGGTGSRVMLVAGSAYATDLLYHDDLLRWAREHPNLAYHTAVSRHAGADGTPPMRVDDRLVALGDAARALLDSDRTLVYLCGVAGMELGVFRALARLLPPAVLARYLVVDPALAGSPQAWERRMIHREVRPTRRVFLEVY
jgi:ferredoxin--NADP+ reductase